MELELQPSTTGSIVQVTTVCLAWCIYCILLVLWFSAVIMWTLKWKCHGLPILRSMLLCRSMLHKTRRYMHNAFCIIYVSKWLFLLQWQQWQPPAWISQCVRTPAAGPYSAVTDMLCKWLLIHWLCDTVHVYTLSLIDFCPWHITGINSCFCYLGVEMLGGKVDL